MIGSAPKAGELDFWCFLVVDWYGLGVAMRPVARGCGIHGNKFSQISKFAGDEKMCKALLINYFQCLVPSRKTWPYCSPMSDSVR